jgi:hypothetical protein
MIPGILASTRPPNTTATNLPTWWTNGIVFACDFQSHRYPYVTSTVQQRSFWRDASPAYRTFSYLPADSEPGVMPAVNSKFGGSSFFREFADINTNLPLFEHLQCDSTLPGLGDTWAIMFWALPQPTSQWNAAPANYRGNHLLLLEAVQDANNYYRLTIHYTPDSVGGTARLRVSWIRSIAGVVTTIDKIIQMTGSVVAGSSGSSWQHLMVLRESNTIKIFANGIEDLTQRQSSSEFFVLPNNFGNYTLIMGKAEQNIKTANFLIDDLLILSGSLLYTENYTPPIYPLIPMASGWWRNKAEFQYDFDAGSVASVVNKGYGGGLFYTLGTTPADYALGDPAPGCQGRSLRSVQRDVGAGTGFGLELRFSPPYHNGLVSVNFYSAEFYLSIRAPVELPPKSGFGGTIWTVEDYLVSIINILGVRVVSTFTGDQGAQTMGFPTSWEIAANGDSLDASNISGLEFDRWYKISINGNRLALDGVWNSNVNVLPRFVNNLEPTISLLDVPLNHELGAAVSDVIVNVGSLMRDRINFTPEPLGLINF